MLDTGSDHGKMSKAKPKKEEEDSRHKLSTYKYSGNGKGDLFEAVLIGGQPYFITYNEKADNVDGYEEYGEKFRIFVPPEPSDYSYPPYEFKDKEELVSTFLQAKSQDLDSLLSKGQSIVLKYNDQDDYKLRTIASDVVWSYFQDRFATTRYEVLVGGVGSGKSALAATFGSIGYRPINTTNPTPAILYRLMGD